MDSILKLDTIPIAAWVIYGQLIGLPTPIAEIIRQYTLQSPQMLLMWNISSDNALIYLGYYRRKLLRGMQDL